MGIMGADGLAGSGAASYSGNAAAPCGERFAKPCLAPDGTFLCCTHKGDTDAVGLCGRVGISLTGSYAFILSIVTDNV